MKRTTLVSSAFTGALILSILTSGFSNTAFAKKITDDDDEDLISEKSVCEIAITPGTKKSLAQQLSELKEEKLRFEDERDELKLEIARIEKKIKASTGSTDLDDYDKVLSIYGPSTCLCAKATACTGAVLEKIGAITSADYKKVDVNRCDQQPAKKGERVTNTDPKDKVKPGATNTSGAIDTDETANPTGNGGKKTTCVPSYKELFIEDLNQVQVCKAVYDYAIASLGDPFSASVTLKAECVASARRCGPVRKQAENDKLPGQLETLKKRLKKISGSKGLISKCDSRIALIKADCADCSVISDQVDGLQKRTVGDYIVGGLQVAMPGIMKGMDMAMYYKGTNANLSAYNSYLGANQANCTAYIAQGTTLGLPSSPCTNAMWSGGVAASNGWGAGGFGVPGGVGYYNQGGYLGGYPGGFIGGYPGQGGVVGNLVGAAFGIPGGGYAGGFQGGFQGGYAGGFQGGFQGGGYMAQGFAGGYAGGFQGGGFQGGFQGGGFQGGFQGGYQGGWMSMGNPNMGGYTGGFQGGYAYDPSMQLNQQRGMMQQQNMQISQQQVLEAQQRYHQVSQGGGYGSIGGGSYGYGYGGGGYGYGYGYGYGGYPSSVGNLVGTLIGGGIGGYGYGAGYGLGY